jgi:hypothetical protein
MSVGNFKNEVDAILKQQNQVVEVSNVRKTIEKLFLKFHSVAIQLKRRTRNKSPFLIQDEYDVQDLLHALLKIDFTNIKPEEYCPSYASVSPRIDFFLKNEQIAIETKMAKKGHGNVKISNELIIDKEYYQKKSGVALLYCVVYDPEEIITNPDGFEQDIYEKSEHFEVKVFVIPKR